MPHQMVPPTATVPVHSQTLTVNDQGQCGRAVSPGMDRGGSTDPAAGGDGGQQSNPDRAAETIMLLCGNS